MSGGYQLRHSETLPVNDIVKSTTTARPVRAQLQSAVLALFFYALGFITLVPLSQADKNTEQLQQLQQRIERLQQKLDKTLAARDSQQADLRQSERRIGRLHQNIRRVEKELKSHAHKLSQLQAQQVAAQRNLKGHGQQLGQQIQAAYSMGTQEYVKLLLNQNDPSEIGRVMVYYHYLTQARLGQIQQTRKTLQGLSRLQQQIAQQELASNRLKQQLTAQKQRLEQTIEQRHQLLAGLNQEVQSQSSQIETLRENERRLQSLVNQLQGVLAETAELPATPQGFGSYRGKLSLPMAGDIFARFDAPKRQGDLKWKGLFLASAEGNKVVSVFRGRVAYADWLHGYGLLLILEHDGGYMTLYGHNRSLYKEVGDWVETGQVIADSGSTGNPPRPGVYFEIRHDGRPHDPLRWCKTG